MLTPQFITGLRPGPDLDKAVHQHVFQRTGRAPRYSTSGAALEALDVFDMQVGRFRPVDPQFRPERPYYCRFQLGSPANPEEYQMTAATAAVALCKGALLHVVVTQPAQPATPAPDAQAAHD